MTRSAKCPRKGGGECEERTTEERTTEAYLQLPNLQCSVGMSFGIVKTLKPLSNHQKLCRHFGRAAELCFIVSERQH